MILTWVFYKKEVRSLFNSWIAYVVLIAFTLLNGINFYIYLGVFEIITHYAESAQEMAERGILNVTEQLVQPLYNSVFILLFILVPGITMRLFSEEKKQRTEELLLTSPVRVGEIVIAKYLAAVTLILLMMAPVAIFPGLVISYAEGPIDIGSIVSGYFALVTLGVSLAAIGVFASSLTENQIVAFVFAVALEMLFFIIAQATVTFDIIHIGSLEINLGSALRTFSITEHFESMLSGILKASDLVYFVSMIGFWLWATRQSVESARWG